MEEKFNLEVIDSKYIAVVDDYKRCETYIYQYLNSISSSFINVGWNLLKIKNNEYYKYDDYESIYEYALDRFNIRETTVKNLINIASKFLDDTGNLLSDFKDYSYSQLIELSKINEKDYIDISPDMSVRELKEIKLESKLEDAKKEKFEELFKNFFNFMKEHEEDFEVLLNNEVNALNKEIENYQFKSLSYPDEKKKLKIDSDRLGDFEAYGKIIFNFENKLKVELFVIIRFNLGSNFLDISFSSSQYIWGRFASLDSDVDNIFDVILKYVQKKRNDYIENKLYEEKKEKLKDLISTQKNKIFDYKDLKRKIDVGYSVREFMKQYNLDIKKSKILVDEIGNDFLVLNDNICLVLSYNLNFYKYSYDEEKKKYYLVYIASVERRIFEYLVYPNPIDYFLELVEKITEKGEK